MKIALQFGIQPLQFNNVMRIVILEGKVHLERFNYAEACKPAIDAGFKHIELLADVKYMIPNSFRDEVMNELLKMREEGITFSVHLPIWSVELASPNVYIRKGSVESLVQSIKILEILEPKCYVVHLTGPLAAEFSKLRIPSRYREMLLNRLTSLSAKSLEEVLSRTGISPRKIAVENVEFPFRYSWEVVRDLNLSICFDTGHLLAGYSGEYTVMDFLQSHWDYIIEIHLHDGYVKKVNDCIIRRDHLPLGIGKLPLKRFIKYLVEHKFKGPIVFELPLSKAIVSLKSLLKFL